MGPLALVRLGTLGCAPSGRSDRMCASDAEWSGVPVKSNGRGGTETGCGQTFPASLLGVGAASVSNQHERFSGLVSRAAKCLSAHFMRYARRMTSIDTRITVSALSFVSFVAFAACGGGTTPVDANNDDITTADVALDSPRDSGFDATVDTGTDASTSDVQPDIASDVAADVAMGPDAGCAFDTTYTYGLTGGFRANVDTSILAPQASFTRSRMVAGGGTVSCTQTVPCGTSGLLDVRAVLAAIDNTDVQAALAIGMDTVYGIDSRPVDGTAFSFQRASDGHSFVIGNACGGAAGCNPIPPGLSTLQTTLDNLDTQEIAMTGCEALR